MGPTFEGREGRGKRKEKCGKGEEKEKGGEAPTEISGYATEFLKCILTFLPLT